MVKAQNVQCQMGYGKVMIVSWTGLGLDLGLMTFGRVGFKKHSAVLAHRQSLLVNSFQSNNESAEKWLVPSSVCSCRVSLLNFQHQHHFWSQSDSGFQTVKDSLQNACVKNFHGRLFFSLQFRILYKKCDVKNSSETAAVWMQLILRGKVVLGLWNKHVMRPTVTLLTKDFAKNTRVVMQVTAQRRNVFLVNCTCAWLMSWLMNHAVQDVFGKQSMLPCVDTKTDFFTDTFGAAHICSSEFPKILKPWLAALLIVERMK